MYTISNSERTNEIASEYETKSLLYLLSMRKDSSEIQLFVVDFFNDVTGMTKQAEKLWDVQAKGVKSLNPKKVGIALYTLYKNYVSELEFNHFILFMPKLKGLYLIDESLKTYGVNNFKSKFNMKIKEGLVEEFNKKQNPEDAISTKMGSIEEFFKLVLFVIGDDNKEDYIKNIINFKKDESGHKELFVSIFDEIRGLQSIIKNKFIEGTQIKKAIESLDYDRHLNKEEIEILIINRLIGINLFDNKTVPISFVEKIKDFDYEDKKDIIQECNEKISIALFNKNNKKNFWIFLEKLIRITRTNINSSIDELYSLLISSGITAVTPLDKLSVLYFLSLIKEGLGNEN